MLFEEGEAYNHTDFHHFGWCPLFGKIPEFYISDVDYLLNQIITIIDESRKIWINSANLKNISEYPEWKLKKATELWFCLVTNFEFLFINRKYSKDTIEEETKYTIDSIKHLIISDITLITDAEILSIFTIYKATAALDFFYNQLVFYDDIDNAYLHLPIKLHVANLLLVQAKKIATQTHGEIKKGKPNKNESGKQVTNIFRWAKGTWEISYDGNTIHIPDRLGLWSIRYLLKQPGEKIHVNKLIHEQSNAGERKELIKKRAEKIEFKDVNESNSEDTGIDTEALNNYRKRLQELKIEMEEAEKDGNEAELNELQKENDKITACIKASVNKNGRLRELNSQVENNRSAVKNRINGALTLIKKEDSSLFKHLNTYIKRGTHCSYTFTEAPPWITD